MVRGLGGRIPKAQRLAAREARRGAVSDDEESDGGGAGEGSDAGWGDASDSGGGSGSDSDAAGRSAFESLPRRVRKRMVKRVSFVEKLHRTQEGIARDKARAMQRRGVRVGVRKKGAALKSLGDDLLGELEAVEAGLERTDAERKQAKKAERARAHGTKANKPSRKQRLRMRKHALETKEGEDGGKKEGGDADVDMDKADKARKRAKTTGKAKAKAKAKANVGVRPPNINGSAKKKLQRMKQRMLRDQD